MRIRSILSLAVSAVAAVALATPAQAADDGAYLIRDLRSGQCLAGGEGPLGGHVEPCNPGTVWEIRNQGDGQVRIVDPRSEDRCLALSPVRIYPPVVWVDQCGNSPDQWSILGPDNGEPVSIALERGAFGYLTTEGNRVVLLPGDRPQWSLQRLG
ncbi:RICIN domain-containing protein [Streptomyces sp. NBC_01591]|uniref:RICIN domain-containing protein n=1 Tax=Streptomyces sp. NBC_01591 TaxID=2975888 RepID=UPI002DDA4168|nr:hypothetical protein [Streptomyces sp. NBC_01591]WSD69924.1 RICIN domain-containing protein [Streptomyces sp. NBC_01591]